MQGKLGSVIELVIIFSCNSLKKQNKKKPRQNQKNFQIYNSVYAEIFVPTKVKFLYPNFGFDSFTVINGVRK